MTKRVRRGFTLIELLVAIAVLAMIAMLIYGAFSSLQRSKQGLIRLSDRYREGRLAMARITRELSSAYLSLNRPLNEQITVRDTAFFGTTGTPADRVDFNTFAHQRLDRNSHESDQAEISYFGSQNPEQREITDLARRVSPRLDLEPERGGIVEVLATDIDLFDLEYLDPLTGRWTERWDSTQTTGQLNRLPYQVRVILVLNDGRRRSEGRGRDTIRFETKITIPIQAALNFSGQ